MILFTYNRISENVFQNHFGKYFPKKFRILRSEIFDFSKTFSEKVNFLENEIWKILKYKWKKINIKITFKSLSENKIRKIMNFEKCFPKIIKAKLEF
jgi:hypothetical protein